LLQFGKPELQRKTPVPIDGEFKGSEIGIDSPNLAVF
jgi:hypothetical protein